MIFKKRKRNNQPVPIFDKTFRRYVLISLPQLIVVILIILLIGRLFDLSFRLQVLLVLLWIGKELVIYPLIKRAYAETHESYSDEVILASEAVAVEEIGRQGFVKVHGIRWQAINLSEGTIPEGHGVRIVRREGLVLHVLPIEQAD